MRFLTLMTAAVLAALVAAPAEAVAALQAKDSAGSEPDVLELALLTIGAAGGAALVALFGYWLRNRIGFWLHRPPPPGEKTGGPEHH